MQLILSRFLRPKWQHPRAEVRRQALAKLNPEQNDECEILFELAQHDRATDVREAALAKLSRPQQLLKLHQLSNSPELQQPLQKRMLSLCCEGDLSASERLPLLDTLVDEADMMTVVLQGNCFEISQEALLRIHSEPLLQRIVLEAPERKLRLLAAEAIRTESVLQALTREVRQKDKQIYRLLKERLDQQREAVAVQAAHREAQQTLCEAVEKLAQEALFPHYDAKLNALQLQWQALASPLQPDLQERFSTASVTCQQRAQILIKEREAEHALLQAQQLLKNTQDEATRLAQQLCHPPESLSEAEATLRTLVSRQRELIPQLNQHRTAALKALDTTLEQAQRNLDCWQRLERFTERSIESPDTALADLIDQLSWPDWLEQPQALITAKQRLANATAESRQRKQQQQARRQQQQAEQQQQLDHLQSLLQDGRFQDANTPLTQLQRSQNTLSAEQKRLLTSLRSQYQELAGWQTFATRPKLEQLCDEMEQLVNTAADDSERAAQLKTLQQRWKALEGPQVPNALRERFQAANHQVYQQCETFFSAQRALRQRNLEQRQQLCEQLSALLSTHNNAPIDLKKLSTEDRRLRREWRNYSPVERNAGKKLQKRFNQQLKQLAQLIQQGQQQAAAEKQTLIDALHTLSGTLDSADQPLNTLKQLQQQWRKIATAERKQEARLWREFSELANELYRRFKDAQSDADNEARQTAEQLCIALEQATQPLAEPFAVLQSQFRTQCQSMLDSKRLQRRFERALVSYQLQFHPQESDWIDLSQFAQCLAQQEQALIDGETIQLDQAERLVQPLTGDTAELARKRLEQLCLLSGEAHIESLEIRLGEIDTALRLLCIRAEILCAKPSPESDQALRMEYQMSRLQDALNSDKQATGCVESLMQLQREWLLTPFNGVFSELNERFTNLLKGCCQ